jgi:hypothetical protein
MTTMNINNSMIINHRKLICNVNSKLNAILDRSSMICAHHQTEGNVKQQRLQTLLAVQTHTRTGFPSDNSFNLNQVPLGNGGMDDPKAVHLPSSCLPKRLVMGPGHYAVLGGRSSNSVGMVDCVPRSSTPPYQYLATWDLEDFVPWIPSINVNCVRD